MTLEKKTWEESEEGKVANALLDKALKAYGCDRKHIAKDETGAEEYRYYSKGRSDEAIKYLNPDHDPMKPDIKNQKYLLIDKPTITFCTQGGQKRHYFDGMDKMKGNVFYFHGSLVEFEDMKLTVTQCDGISRIKLKKAY